MNIYNDVQSTLNEFSSHTPSQPIALVETTQNSTSNTRFSQVPNSLIEIPNWVLWKFEDRKDKQGNIIHGKKAKVPRQTNGKNASVSDPLTWCSFKQAINTCCNGYNGIGFVVKGQINNQEIIGIDVDHPFDSELSQEFITHFKNTYCEKSPSNKLRIFCTGSIPRSGKGNLDKLIEVYDKNSSRYLTVTGNHIDGTGLTVEPCQDALDWAFKRFFSKTQDNPLPLPQNPSKKQTVNNNVHSDDVLSDEQIIELCRRAKNSAKFESLFNGGGNEDKSSGDMALCGIIAFYAKSTVGQGVSQIDRIVRQSSRENVHNGKWDTKHHADGRTYGQVTCQKAFDNQKEVYNPGNLKNGKKSLDSKQVKREIESDLPTSATDNSPKPQKFNLKFIPTDQHGFNADLERAIKSGQSEEAICKDLQEKHPTIEGINIRVARATKKVSLSDDVRKAFSEQYRDYVIGSKTIEEIANKFEISELSKGITNIMPQFLNYCEKRKFASNPDKLNLTGLIVNKNNDKYIDIPTPPENIATYIIKSPMGTGKTVSLEKMTDDLLKQGKTIAYVCHRVSLSQSAAKLLKIEHYQDKNKMSKDKRKKYEEMQPSDKPVQSISIVANSIPGFKGFNGNTPDVVFIDENDQVLKHISGGACKNGAEVLETLQEWVKNARFVAVLSANIDQRSIEFVKSLRGNKPIYFFENTYQPKKGQEITLVRKPENIYERITANLLTQKVGCAVVATNSFNESVAVEKYLKEKFPTKRILAINSDCSQSDETREIIANINDKIRELDCLIYSPSIGSGVSIDYTNISGVFGIFYATSGGTPSDAWQQIGRVRKLDVPTFLYVENRQQFDLPITEDEVWEQYAKKIDAQEKQFERSEKDWTGCEIQQVFYTYQLGRFDRLSVINTITTNKANQDFKLNFILEGERKGIKFRFENEKSPEFKQARTEIANAIKEEYRQAVLNANDLSGQELSNLERKKELGLNFSRDEKLSLEKLDIKKVFAPKNDDELERTIELDNNGKGRHIINRIRAIVQPIEEIARPDYDLIRTLVDEKRLSNITDHRTALLDRELIQRLFNATGITLTENGLNSDGRSFDAHSPEITSFCQWVSNMGIEPERKINSIFKNPIKYIGDQLRTLNIGLKRKKENDAMYYAVNIENFQYNNYISCNIGSHTDPTSLKKHRWGCDLPKEKEKDQHLEFLEGNVGSLVDEQTEQKVSTQIQSDSVKADNETHGDPISLKEHSLCMCLPREKNQESPCTTKLVSLPLT